MAAAPIRILIVDDHPVVRDGLKSIFDTEPGLEVVAEAGNGAEAIEAARQHLPDVVLMDLVMPGCDGIEAARRILEDNPRIGVLALTSYGTDAKLFPALEAGVLGFLLKDVPGTELVGAIRHVAGGRSALSPVIARRLVRELAHERGLDAPQSLLTERETDVLREIARGLSNREIAEKLFISEATVHTHINHIFSKLGITRRTEAVLYALKHGIADLAEAGEKPS
jgi:NarL family two-component system response regulator LiaR